MDSVLSFLGEHYVVGLLSLCIIFAGISAMIKSFMNFDYKDIETRVRFLELIVFEKKKEEEDESISEGTVSRIDKGKLDS